MATVWTAPLMTDLVKPCTSDSVMRPLMPLPLTSFKGTPSSRANLRTEGDAWGRPRGADTGSWAGRTAGVESAATVGATAAGAAVKVLVTTGVGVGVACVRVGAPEPATPSSTAIKSPILTLSPSLTFSSLTTPPALDGISIAALSDSTVISDCSALTVSPTLTSSSITATSLKSPISGKRTSTGPTLAGTTGVTAATAAAAGAGADFVSATGAGVAVATGAAPASSSVTTNEPCLTLSPTLTSTSLTTPAWLDGISIDALSDSTVISDWSSATVSPGLTISSITVTSSKSPISGT